MRMQAVILTGAILAAFILNTATATLLCDAALHPERKDLTETMQVAAKAVAQHANASNEAIQLSSFDGAKLSAWFFRTPDASGGAVILLRGSGDNRAGMLGFVPMFLNHHYSVLVPDSRAHGQSGGDLATFGVKESQDLNRWADWLSVQANSECVYGLGESMGAAILLQSLPNEPRFCAVVAESPFSSFREVAYDRVGQKLGTGAWMGRTLLRPLISEAFLEAKLRYHVNLDKASPVKAVANTRVPVLLIHGMEDFNIPVRHCDAICKKHSGVMEFWKVPGTGHTGAFGRDPREFERRVTDWFSRYSRKQAAVVEIPPGRQGSTFR
jgi:dipeptidyl aminopeptidase/acylaminoacyl peptidase